jgi:hypothetical protein
MVLYRNCGQLPNVSQTWRYQSVDRLQSKSLLHSLCPTCAYVLKEKSQNPSVADHILHTNMTREAQKMLSLLCFIF